MTRRWAIKRPGKSRKPFFYQKETEITKNIREVLRKLGIPHIKYLGGFGSVKGVPDIHGSIPPNGRALWLEVKKPGSFPRPEQEDFLERHKRAGALAFWADSVPEVVKMLAREGHQPAVEMAKMLPPEPSPL